MHGVAFVAIGQLTGREVLIDVDHEVYPMLVQQVECLWLLGGRRASERVWRGLRSPLGSVAYLP